MNIIGEGPNWTSYRFKVGEKPGVLPSLGKGIGSSISFKMCSRCKQKGVFEYT